MTKSQIRTQLSAFLVVIPYYLSLRYNQFPCPNLSSSVVIPYYFLLRYNNAERDYSYPAVVIPYYLSLRYNRNADLANDLERSKAEGADVVMLTGDLIDDIRVMPETAKILNSRAGLCCNSLLSLAKV